MGCGKLEALVIHGPLQLHAQVLLKNEQQQRMVHHLAVAVPPVLHVLGGCLARLPDAVLPLLLPARAAVLVYGGSLLPWSPGLPTPARVHSRHHEAGFNKLYVTLRACTGGEEALRPDW